MKRNDIDALARAQAQLTLVEERFANYDGNNPGKWRAHINVLRSTGRALEESLKTNGLFPLSEAETLWRRLDAAYPKARSRQVVEFEGRGYRCRFVPLEMSRSGKTVKEWSRTWEIAD